VRVAFRLLKTRFAHDPLSGEGARLYGGRWNSPGVSVVYLGSSVSLCALDVLVHLQATRPLDAYSLASVELDRKHVQLLDRSSLPASWRHSPAPASVQAIGDAWVRSGTSLALEVPSAVIPSESTLVVNTLHPAFASLRLVSVAPFALDPRLFA
jgi:RES domain-containing protein